jgi:predicted PurR-regulated permease PerM
MIASARREPPRAPVDSEPRSAPAAPTSDPRTQRAATAVITVVACAAACWVASALWTGLLVGVLTAFAVEPLFRRVVRLAPARPGLAAMVVLAPVAVGSTLVGAGVVAILARELIDGVESARDFVGAFLAGHLAGAAPSRALAAVGVTPALIAQRADRLAERAVELASGVLPGVVGSAASWLVGALVALVTAYFTLRDRRPLERRLEVLSPLHPATTRELLLEFRRIGRGTLVGSAIAAALQGALAALGFALGGVPRALLLGILTSAASLVPALGTLLVFVPVGVALVVAGRAGAGLFELAWGFLVTSSLVDYVLRPLLVGRESRSHPLLFLVGVIGGVEALGGAGLLAGPIVMAVFAAVLRIYRRDFVGGAEPPP